MSQSEKCFCGHAKGNHISDTGLCLVRSCTRPNCFIFRSVRDARAASGDIAERETSE